MLKTDGVEFKKIHAEVKLQDILDFFQEGEDCKLVVNSDCGAYILPVHAAGYGNEIMSDELSLFDFEDAGDIDTYQSWLNDCYSDGIEITGSENFMVYVSIT